MSLFYDQPCDQRELRICSSIIKTSALQTLRCRPRRLAVVGTRWQTAIVDLHIGYLICFCYHCMVSICFECVSLLSELQMYLWSFCRLLYRPRRLHCCNLQQAIWMNKRFVEQRFPSSYKRSSQSITFSSAADALSYIQTTEWSKKVSLTFFAITLSTVSQLDGLTLHPPVANFLYIIVYMCQKLWKLAGSRLSYCKNY